MRLSWTENALLDLGFIEYYYIEVASSAIAKRVIRGIVQRCEVLKSHPRIGSINHELNRRGKLRYLIYEKWRIEYRLVDQDIVLLSITHISRDFKRNPGSNIVEEALAYYGNPVGMTKNPSLSMWMF